jgi:hypothetical protein
VVDSPAMRTDDTVVSTNVMVGARDAHAFIDEALAAGSAVRDLGTAIWRAAHERGFDDVSVPRPSVSARIEGFTIFACACEDERVAIVVDCGTQFLALVAGGRVPASGSRVRILPQFGANTPWACAEVQSVGLGLRVHFDGKPNPSKAWIPPLQRALANVIASEAAKRVAIDARRQALPVFERVPPLKEELRRRHDALMARVEQETKPSPDEVAALARAGEKRRTLMLTGHHARRLGRYHDELQALRAAMPEYLAQRERAIAASLEVGFAAQRLEDMAAHSRNVTDRSLIAQEQLRQIEASELTVSGDPSPALADEDTAVTQEILATVGLLFDLRPHRGRTSRS